MQGTVDRTIEDLVSHGLCHRYIVDDRLRGNESAFLVASFWLADVLAAQGRREEARRAFERATRCAGPLGLLAEEADPVSGELAGNHPQGLSHLGLISAAIRLADARRGEGGRQRDRGS
jgi:GH15 family glucan-1,4-alpha-glucosidase